MKSKLYVALAACALLAGLLATTPRAAVAEGTCASVGATCAVGPDGTIYTKGGEQLEEPL